MPRSSRIKSPSDYYHVILRGVNRQDIFYDDFDREKMLECIECYSSETKTDICAYCLMSNHIHILIKTSERPGAFIKKVACSYVFYFNRKYDRSGHLFQERFKSEVIDTKKYLLTVFRYILQNPQKAGIGTAYSYPWNSWESIRHPDHFCNISQILEIAGGCQALQEFVLKGNEDECMEADQQLHLSESEALKKALVITEGEHPLMIAQYPPVKRKETLIKMKSAGLSVRQISRLTGINRNSIQRA